MANDLADELKSILEELAELDRTQCERLMEVSSELLRTLLSASNWPTTLELSKEFNEKLEALERRLLAEMRSPW